eukprot:scaffold164_cov105-Isochrysis_galbana.AAC.2
MDTSTLPGDTCAIAASRACAEARWPPPVSEMRISTRFLAFLAVLASSSCSSAPEPRLGKADSSRTSRCASSRVAAEMSCAEPTLRRPHDRRRRSAFRAASVPRLRSTSATHGARLCDA